MCVSDWRLGQFIAPTPLLTQVNGLNTIGPDPTRVGILFTVGWDFVANAPTEFTLSIDNIAENMRFSSQYTPFLLSLQDHGQIVQRRLFVSLSSGAGLLDAIAFNMPHEIIAASQQSFHSEYDKWLKSNFQ